MMGSSVCGRVVKARETQRRLLPCDDQRVASQYFLEASISIPSQSIETYFDIAGTARDNVHDKTDMRMLIAAQSLTSTELLHFWTMPSADTLRDSMIAMADDVAFTRVDQMASGEQQDLCTPIGIVPSPRPTNRRGAYLQLSGSLASKDLAEFQAIYEAQPPLLERRYDIRFFGCFLNVSGRVNRVMSLWVIERRQGVSNDLLARLPGLHLLNQVEVSHWLATSYHP
jgi:hypothetical protein